MSCPLCDTCPRCHPERKVYKTTVPGEPASWQVGTRRRPAKELRPWKELVGWSWRQFMCATKFTGPVRVDARFLTRSKRKDVDNMAKALIDGLKNVAFEDDNRVYAVVLWKEPAPEGQAGAEVWVQPWTGHVWKEHL